MSSAEYDVLLLFPAPQSSQAASDVAPAEVEAEYFPLAHFVHSKLSLGEYVPGAHSTLSPPWQLNPDRHRVGWREGSEQECPEGQSTHAAVLFPLAYFPLGQRRHPPEDMGGEYRPGAHGMGPREGRLQSIPAGQGEQIVVEGEGA